MRQAGPIRKHVPNMYSTARALCCPLIYALYESFGYATWWQRLLVLAVYGAGAGTDSLDGDYARRWNCRTKLGAFIDPAADKLLAWAGLGILWAEFPAWQPYLLFVYAPIAFYDLSTTLVRLVQACGVPLTFETGPTAKERTFIMQGVLCLFLLLELVCTFVEAHILADAVVTIFAFGGLLLIVVWTLRSGYEYFSSLVGWTPSATG